MLYIFYFIFGICIGSFLNVVIYRLPLNISISKGRSFCTACKHKLGVLDLFPIFSYIFLKGKCRYCKEKISIRYLFVEILGGLGFLFAFNTYGPSLRGILLSIFICILIVGSFIDIDYRIVPNRLSILIIIISLIDILKNNPPSIKSRILGFIIIGLVMITITLITNGGIGGGDIKLMAVSGLYIGLSKIIPAFFIGYILATIYCMPKMLKGSLKKGDMIPMIPFFSISLFIMAIYGGQIINLYLSLIL